MSNKEKLIKEIKDSLKSNNAYLEINFLIVAKYQSLTFKEKVDDLNFDERQFVDMDNGDVLEILFDAKNKKGYPSNDLTLRFLKENGLMNYNNNRSIKEKIKDYKLIPLFPDANIGANEEMICKITETSISFSGARKVNELGFICMVVFNKKDGIYNCTYSSLIFRGQGESLKTIYDNTVTSTKANLPDLMNFYNEFYEQWAKEVNKLISDDLKEELEKAKEEQKQKEEQENQEGESQESESGESEESEEQESSESGEGEESEGQESSEGGDESGGEGEGESSESGEQGEGESSESGEQGEGEGGEMSSEDIQKMIEEIEKAQSGENQQGQSQSGSENIDLEDFLNEVENGNADNDFTKNYNNQELKSKIDYDKKEEQSEQQSSGQGAEKQNEFESYEVKDSLGAVKVLLEISTDEVKRRFPNKKAVSGFIASLSKAEIDTIASQVGIPQGISNVEKQKQISNNLAKEINI